MEALTSTIVLAFLVGVAVWQYRRWNQNTTEGRRPIAARPIAGPTPQCQQCQRCGARQIWWIERVGVKDQNVLLGGGDPLMLAVGKAAPSAKGFDVYDSGLIDAYTCAACGYTEFWARDFDKLVHNPDDGVHLIDTTPQRGEYR